MRPIRTITVIPALPEKISRLRELAYNLCWSWDHETIDLFRRLDRDLWETSGHNPVRMLGVMRQEALDAIASDEGFLAQMERVLHRFDQYIGNTTAWYPKTYGSAAAPGQPPLLIAFFSPEFGLADAIPLYSGGLGVLSGDSLKSASDMGLPLVGVGLLYQQGYFRQYLNADGWQGERYPVNDFYNMPITLERKEDGSPVTVEVPYPGRKVVAQVWRIQVGRVPLYMLDTNVAANSPEDQDITDTLYGGDLEMRIKQEIMIGIGGMRALAALGLRPTVCHMNEGHSAFLGLERIRMLMEEGGLSFSEAREAAAAGNIFTTHSNVPAAIDQFPPALVNQYFADYLPALGLSPQEFLALGRPLGDNDGPFNMAILAMRLSAVTAGVSKLHGRVARTMWQSVWPDVPEDEIPITSITNGIHLLSWVSQDIAGLYDRYLGPQWRNDPTNAALWARIDQVPAEELWRTHERRRERLVAFVRMRLRAQREQQGAPPAEIAEADEVLDPGALTIGFARRFATYKRATLLMHDPERLARILNDPDRPVQIIFAGKAHPHDNEGKEMIRQIIHVARQDEFRRRIVFIEDYDMNVARYLLQGADIWLNTPRRPREASGTSGMKAAANGALNVSILDGWWDEAYTPEVGWAIGRGEEYEDLEYQDEVESNALYDLLEKEIVPLFYDRGANGLPRRWISRMKASMRALCPTYNTDRVLREYTEQLYLPAAERYTRLVQENAARARTLAQWKAALRQGWDKVEIGEVTSNRAGVVNVGAEVEVWAHVHLGDLSPEDVRVQLYCGPVDADGRITHGQVKDMACAEAKSDGDYVFVGTVPCSASGLYGYTVRVVPHHEDLTNPFEAGLDLILWAEIAGG